MAKIYNNKILSKSKATLGEETYTAYKYRGFSSREYKKNYKLFDFELVKRDIINHFYIRKGEKLENPEFGTIIWDMLFENFTDEVKRLISEDVETIINYDPRIAINSIIVDSTDQGIRIEADIVYIPFNINERMTFKFDKNNSIIN